MVNLHSSLSGFSSREAAIFPGIINVEVFRGSCPCSCVHCPVGRIPAGKRMQEFGEGDMNLALFRKICGEISSYPWAFLRIHAVGEPLLWKDLPGALEIATKSKVKTWLFTSAVTNDTKLLHTVCRHTNIIEVSVNSCSRQDYLNTKGIDRYAEVCDNLKHMRTFCNLYGSRLILSRTQTIHREQDEKFVRFWKESGIADDVFVRSYHTYNGRLPELSPDMASGSPHPCLVHWARFNISLNGYAVVCFNELFNRNLNPDLIYGDIRNQTIQEIWKGEKINSLRKASLAKEYSDLTFGSALPCQTCTSCQPLNGSRTTSEYQLQQLSGHRSC